MAKPFIPTDLGSLKPIVEAMIFASEEPIGPRTLLRLLFEEEKKGIGQDKNGGSSLFGTALMEGSGADDPAESDAETEPAEEPPADAAEMPEADAATLPDAEAPPEFKKEIEDAGEPDGGPEEEGAKEEREEEEMDEKQAAPETLPQNEKKGADSPEAAAGPIGQKELRIIIDELNEEYELTGRPFRIIEIAGGFQFATTREYGEFVGLLTRDKMRRKLSPAALETLAIVAYRQPVTKPEVEAIRGVNCDQVLLSLLERNLLAITGRAETVGKPLLYGTTEEFLRGFGLNSLNDLPKLRELEELMEEDAHSPTKPEIIPEQIADQLLELNLAEREENGEDKGEDDRASEGESDEGETENGGSRETEGEETPGKENQDEENEPSAEVVESEEEVGEETKTQEEAENPLPDTTSP